MITDKKIVYDHQMFSFQKIGGITRYFTDLITHLPEGYSSELPISWSENLYLLESGLVPLKQLPGPVSFRIKRRFYYFFNQQASRKVLRKENYDLLHPTYYDPWFLKQTRKPYVITIHDMIHEKFRDSFASFDPTSRDKRLLAEKAAHIIAVSHNTKKDIIELFDIPASRISVVHHGYDQRVEPSEQLFRNYILYVGDRKGYKNFRTFIDAISSLLQKEKELKVVCTGKPFHKQEREVLKQLGIENQVHQISASDGQLASLYKYALFFIYPSLYKGFGIPVLEAYHNHCPVCLSNTSCFPEVAAGAACYFDPLDKESILHAVEKILYDTGYANDLRRLGEKRLKEFSIEKMVTQTCNIYKQIG